MTKANKPVKKMEKKKKKEKKKKPSNMQRGLVNRGLATGMTARTWGLRLGLAAVPSSSPSSTTSVMVQRGVINDMWRRGAVKKTGGASKNGRKARPKYLGPKRADGEEVNAGEILLRQRGTRIHPGEGVGCGRDHTLYATIPGIVSYSVSHFPVPRRRLLNVLPLEVGLARRVAQLRNRPSQL